jgi:hypothetical protein
MAIASSFEDQLARAAPGARFGEIAQGCAKMHSHARPL